MSIADRIIARITRRDCDLPIGGKADSYLRRWYVIPRNRWFNLYLHNIRRSDDDRALHDHPWWNCSIILKGAYVEIVPTRGATTVSKYRATGSVTFRAARDSHRLVITDKSGPVWTLFITGPKLRRWGFWCTKGWVDFEDFTAGPQGELVGRGCGEP